MSTLGPYLVYTDSQPTTWCYFDTSDVNHVICYHAPYPNNTAAVTWARDESVNIAPRYVYDPNDNKPACYALNRGTLYRLPVNQSSVEPIVTSVEKLQLTNTGIKWSNVTEKMTPDYSVLVKLSSSETTINTSQLITPTIPTSIYDELLSEPVLNAINRLNIHDIATEQNIALIKESSCPIIIAKTLIIFKKAGLLADPVAERNRDALRKRKDNPHLNYVIEMLSESDLMNQVNFDVVVVLKYSDLTNITEIIKLLKPDLMNQANFDIVVKHSDLPSIIKIIELLKPELMNQANFDIVVKHSSLPSIIKIIELLKPELMNQANFDIVVKHSDLTSVVKIINLLKPYAFSKSAFVDMIRNQEASTVFSVLTRFGQNRNLMTQLNIDAVLKHSKLSSVIEIINTLNSFTNQVNYESVLCAMIENDALQNPDAQEYIKALGELQSLSLQKKVKVSETTLIKAVLKHSDPSSVVNILKKLQSNQLLLLHIMGDANFDKVMQHEHPSDVVDALVILNTSWLFPSDIINETNFNAVIQHSNISSLVAALTMLRTKNLFLMDEIKVNFNALIKHKDPLKVANVLCAIQEMQKYSTQTIGGADSPKGKIITQLAGELRNKLFTFMNLTEEDRKRDLKQFQTEFSTLLDSQNAEMKVYSTAWSTIRKNIALALTGIGILVIVVKLTHSLATEGRMLFPFQKKQTTCEEKKDAVQKSVAECFGPFNKP